MGRHESPLSAANDPVTELARSLRELRDRSGRPTYREMARASGRSSAALCHATSGKRLPSWEVTEAFVTACNGDLREWRARWDGASETTLCPAESLEREHARDIDAYAAHGPVPAPALPTPESVRSAADLIELMCVQRASVGKPSLRVIAARARLLNGTDLPPSTLSDMLRGTSLPPLGAFETFARVCGVTPRALERWQAAWARVAAWEALASRHGASPERTTTRGTPRPHATRQTSSGTSPKSTARLRAARSTLGPGTYLRAFCDGLQELRHAANLTYAQLGARAGLTAPLVREAARGDTLPSRHTVLAWVTACGGDEQTWHHLWDRLVMLREEGRGEDEGHGEQPTEIRTDTIGWRSLTSTVTTTWADPGAPPPRLDAPTRLVPSGRNPSPAPEPRPAADAASEPGVPTDIPGGSGRFAGPAAPPARAAADGVKTLGAYRIVRRLGGGGMGEVFLGRTASGAEVAIKCMRTPSNAYDDDMRARFAREVAASRAVQSLFTVPVIASDVDAEVPWYATPYMHGPGLDSHVAAQGPLPTPLVLRLAVAVAEALGDIHAAGVVHRDLKPSNVLITENGPRVIDFGISTLPGQLTLTMPGSVIGSLGYMAPECLEGGAPTPASDVFNLGLTTVFAATGSNLYQTASPASMLHKILMTDADLGHLDPILRPMVAACLDRDPGNRPTPQHVVRVWGRMLNADAPHAWLPGPEDRHSS